MTTYRVGRRRFLMGSAALSGATVVSACGGDQPDGASPEDGPLAAGDLPAGIAAIGSGYLEVNETLTEATLAQALPARVDSAARPEVQLKLAAETIAGDFGADRVERVNGWWVSQTEASICALAVLRA